MRHRAKRIVTAVVIAAATAIGCGGGSTPAVKACDVTCQDQTALLAMRNGLKLVYNLTLQGKPVGMHDEMVPGGCPLGGTARVYGNATSNAQQGATFVSLTYVLDHCAYELKDSDPTQTFHMTFTGTITENGTISVQPTSTTALTFGGTITMTGTVSDPAIDYAANACPLALGQNGNQLSGTLCGRDVGVTL